MANRNSSPYASAGWLLNEHIEKRRGLKSIAFDGGSKKGAAPDKATYATVCKTLQHLSTINSILNSDNKKLRKAIDFDSVRSKGLLYVMLYELLFGKYKSIRGGGKIKRLIMKHESELRKEAEVYGTEDVIAGVNFPRYIRVNTLHTNAADVVDKLKQDLTTSSKEEVNDEGATRQAMYVDPNVPDLLVLPPTTSSWLHHDYTSVQSGQIVLQDKSSCFSALVMANGLGQGSNEDEPFDYIDACAAPGNKTCHLAALVNSSLDNDGSQSTKKNKKKKGKNKPKSTIYAFERSSTRYNILQERMNKLVPSTTSSNEIKVEVEPIHGDFLRSDPSDPKFANVRAIMLDPSCSGSGIVNSPDRWMEESSGGSDGDKKDDKRIQSLSNFQLVALKHAMSFPTVDRIVYSTCSVYDEENEVVVSKALSEVVEMSQNDDNNDESWQLLAPKCLADWKRRGKVGGIGGLTKDQADCLVRCDGMDGDETNGFFVAFFVRNKLLLSSSENERIKIDDVGVPIYSGQFVDMCKAVTPPTNVADGGTKKLASNIDASKQQSRKEQPIPLQKTKKKNDTTTAAGDKKSAKKREKKMAWKRKQALLKSQRLKKKEDAAAAEAKGDNK